MVDVSNPASPVQVGAAKVGSSDFVMAYAVDADASDDYIYIASLSGLYMIDISDPVAVLNYVFLGREKIPEPISRPGQDATSDLLICAQ